MAGRACKCGGKYSKIGETLEKFEYSCESCGSRFIRKRKNTHKYTSPSHNFSHLEIGKGVADYLLYLQHEVMTLEKKVKEMEECVKERDSLQKQISEMQERYNASVMEKDVKIPKGFI